MPKNLESKKDFLRDETSQQHGKTLVVVKLLFSVHVGGLIRARQWICIVVRHRRRIALLHCTAAREIPELPLCERIIRKAARRPK